MKNLEDFIFTGNYLPKEDCEYIVNSISQRDWKKHEWHENINNSYQSEQEKELDVYMSDEVLQEKLHPYILKAINDYTKEKFFDADKTKYLVTRYSPVRFNRYENAKMRTHYDHIHSIFDGDRKGIPVLSILGVLNDNYKGGNFLFYDEHEVKLRQGDILIFPSIFLYPHKVREVTEGTRYSFITWAF